MGRVKNNPEQCKHSHYLHYGSGMPVFKGETRQIGYGLGSILGGLARTVLPVLKPVAKNLVKSALKTPARILGDVITGRNSIKTSTRKRVAQALKESIDERSRTEQPRTKRRKKVKKQRKSKKFKDIL